MTLDRKIQVWNAVGTGVAGIGTIAAVIVALRLARDSRRVRLQVRVGIYWLIHDTARIEYVGFDVTNLADRAVTIASVGWVIDRSKKERMAMQVPSRAIRDDVPKRLEHGQGATFGVPLDRLDWLGTVGRAHSAVPLHHEMPDLAVLPLIEARYRAHGLAPVFRLPSVTAFDTFRGELRERGFAEAKSTLVMLGTPAAMALAADARGVELADAPGDDWARVYLGEGFDAVDGASRVRLLRRAREAVYASLREPADGDVVAAVGCACLSHGLASVHGMRTRPAFRGRGLARRLLPAMGNEALRRGIGQAFLQVETGNDAARALYARCGFEAAWRYAYWQRH